MIRNPIMPGDLPALCERVRAHVARSRDAIVCDVSTLTEPDLGTVDALARLELAVKKLGGALALCGVGPRLRELLELTGLEETLCVEAPGQPEQREQALRVEEEADAGDGAAGDRQDL